MVLCLLFAFNTHAFSNTTPPPAEARETPLSLCQAVAQRGGVIRAAATPASSSGLQPFEVSITYVGHSTFRVEDATGVVAATDYAGNAGPGKVPDVVTMNHAHSTHWTPNPDPRIPYVLKGWGENGAPASHHVQIGETIIRNVTTDINSTYSGFEENGNSIFIFEMGGLCIGHLGHLHHLLTDEHYAKIGRLDVLMVPVDGGYTLNLADMTKIVKRLNASVILPMHWFGEYSLQRFLTGVKEGFAVEVKKDTSITLSLNTLPATATVMVLQPQTYFGIFGD
ncbi:MAG: MBL fold metallo-hydrolase [Pseudomonadota bacterium]